ncbi:hypothetical protein [Polycyclovorans algicola]|uniref:hypothetical protein n=1 Tax=Polycyclovorans algicola TaxID=616992 RepID=UPI0012681539|nr:hypothetical protein [Polycyclovorans algicola]
MDEFSRTPRVMMNTALATEDARDAQSPVALRLHVRLLAAAGQAEPCLPHEGWVDQSRLIKLTPSFAQGELHIAIQAQGYEALQRLAGREARLISANGLLDEALGFDLAGSALLVLRDDVYVQHALTNFQIVIA